MESRWIVKQPRKQQNKCCACGTYKVNAQFYDWYVHPCISGLFKDTMIGIICIKCAKREAGTKHFREIDGQ